MSGYVPSPVIQTDGVVETGTGSTPREAMENTLRDIREMTPEEATTSEQMATDKGLCEVYLGRNDPEEVEVRFWGEKDELGDDGPNVKVRFEVYIREPCPFYTEMGVYSADNIRNGSEYHRMLDDELREVVREVLGDDAARDLNLVIEKGSSAFSGTARFQ